MTEFKKAWLRVTLLTACAFGCSAAALGGALASLGTPALATSYHVASHFLI